MPVSDLYEADFFAWTEQQAAVLRDLARSRRELPNALDLDHVAEEIEDMGRSELATVKSLIRNIFIHLCKCALAPKAPAHRHWRGEIRTFAFTLRERFAPSMRQNVELDKIWRDAQRQVFDSFDIDTETFSQTCPIPLDMLLADPPDLEALAELLVPCLDRSGQDE